MKTVGFFPEIPIDVLANFLRFFPAAVLMYFSDDQGVAVLDHLGSVICRSEKVWPKLDLQVGQRDIQAERPSSQSEAVLDPVLILYLADPAELASVRRTCGAGGRPCSACPCSAPHRWLAALWRPGRPWPSPARHGRVVLVVAAPPAAGLVAGPSGLGRATGKCPTRRPSRAYPA